MTDDLARTTGAETNEAEEIRDVERSRLRALVGADMTGAQALHATDFQLVNPHGGILSKEEYLLDSAHHGIAMNRRGTKLCVAGTMSDYAAIVSRRTTRYKLIRAGEKPYWSTTSANGRLCYVSWSGTDTISVLSYRKGKEVARVKVGDHPQRVRTGFVTRAWLRANQ